MRIKDLFKITTCTTSEISITIKRSSFFVIFIQFSVRIIFYIVFQWVSRLFYRCLCTVSTFTFHWIFSWKEDLCFSIKRHQEENAHEIHEREWGQDTVHHVSALSVNDHKENMGQILKILRIFLRKTWIKSL